MSSRASFSVSTEGDESLGRSSSSSSSGSSWSSSRTGGVTTSRSDSVSTTVLTGGLGFTVGATAPMGRVPESPPVTTVLLRGAVMVVPARFSERSTGVAVAKVVVAGRGVAAAAKDRTGRLVTTTSTPSTPGGAMAAATAKATVPDRRTDADTSAVRSTLFTAVSLSLNQMSTPTLCPILVLDHRLGLRVHRGVGAGAGACPLSGGRCSVWLIVVGTRRVAVAAAVVTRAATVTGVALHTGERGVAVLSARYAWVTERCALPRSARRVAA